ncbi:hypothetical protein ACHAWU_000063 [Discostella pseudostelligera]|uniref:Uncharacterized protein n=1 Tax=Discostella pseudostelligera TaxID=259834 RepID=A0ABD3N917_9STRA
MDTEMMYHLHYHFRSIDSKLIVYERLTNVATLLELALWKSMMSRQEFGQVLASDGNLSDARLQHRANCGAPVIIPNVLSFLTDDTEKEEDDEDQEDCEDSDNYSDEDSLMDHDDY